MSDPREVFECPKCGEITHDPYIEWVAPWLRVPIVADTPPTDREEHIRVTCRKCGFTDQRPIWDGVREAWSSERMDTR